MEDSFLKNFADAMEKSSPVGMEDDFRGYEEWDSLSLLVILSMIDDEYGVHIDANQFTKMRTVRDIFEFVAREAGLEKG